MSTPTREEQIRQTHAALIVAVVKASQNRDRMPELNQLLDAAEAQGWTDLVPVIRRILEGERGPKLLLGLDEEDSVIVAAIVQGMVDPTTLPDPDAKPDPMHAAPGLAAIVHAASRGDTQALQMLGGMAEQMQQAGGELARVGGNLRRLLNGERDAEQLTKGMGVMGRQLMESILEELGRLDLH
jgi:hypothetical protein